MGQGDIEVFLRSDCAPCIELESYLVLNNISYTAHWIDQDEKQLGIFQTLGGQTPPLINIKGTIIQGLNYEAINEALNLDTPSEP